MQGNDINDTFRDTEKETGFNFPLFVSKYIIRYWILYVISLMIAWVAGYYYFNYYATPVYSATTSVIIKEAKSKGDATDLIQDLGTFASDQNLQNEIQILRSRNILTKTIKALDFDVSYTLKEDAKKRELYKDCPFEIIIDSLKYFAYSTTVNLKVLNDQRFELTYVNPRTEQEVKEFHRFGEKFTTQLGFLSAEKKDNFNARSFNNPNFEKRNFIIHFNSLENLITKYTNVLDVAIAAKGTSILVLSVTDNAPEKAIEFLNKLVEVWLQNNIDEKNEIARNSLTFIDEQLALISKDLNEAEGNYEEFRTQKGITDISADAQSYLSSAEQYDKEIANINLKLSFLNTVEKYIKDGKNLRSLSPASMGIQDELLLKLIFQLNDLYVTRDKLSIGATPDNPSLIQNNLAIESTKANLLETLGNIKKGMIASQNAAYVELSRVEGKIRTLPGTQREVVNIQRQVTLNADLYTYLSQKRAETAILLASATSDNRLIDKAHASFHPIKPVRGQVYSIAFILGLVLPAGFAFFRETLDNRIKDKKDLESLTNIPLVGIVGVNESDTEIVVKKNPRSQITESFRSVRTNLQFFTQDPKKTNVILVTSSISSEGKSFCAVNLAAMIALTGKKTVLLGFDLRKPKPPERFDLKSEIGISNFLIGMSTIDDIIQHTDFENMDIVLSGPKPPNPSELLMSDKITTLFSTLSEKYQCIVVDTSPIGLVADAMMLVPFATSTMYVVRQKLTRKQHLEHINKLYNEGKIRNIGILMNAVKRGAFEYGYGYGDGYGYGYGDGSGYYEVDESSKSTLKNFFKRKKKQG